MSVVFRSRPSPKTPKELSILLAGMLILIPIAPFLFASIYLSNSKKDRITHLSFNSSLPEDEEYSDDGDLLAPNGKLTANILVSLLDGCDLRPDLEDEAWDFLRRSTVCRSSLPSLSNWWTFDINCNHGTIKITDCEMPTDDAFI